MIDLPSGDANYAMRWRLIKMGFSKPIPPEECRSKVRQKRGERGIWQRRYWEHLIRDEEGYHAHMDTVHFNPLKHGLALRVADWPFSTVHRPATESVFPKIGQVVAR